MAPKRHPLTAAEAFGAVEMHGSNAKAARALGVSEALVQKRVLDYYAECEKERGVTDAKVKSKARPLDKLLADKCDTFQRYDEYEESVKLIERKVLIDGPIGIVHFGDPHLDSDGTDMPTLIKHVEVVKKSEGMFAANVGDMTNNWVGRLSRLRGEESVTAEESWVLAEWLVKALPWLYIIGGNHDLWSGEGDPLKFFSAQHRLLYEGSRVRMGLNFKNGKQLRINARHDFQGYSMWNGGHGATKAAFFHAQDHIYCCGHKHTSWYAGPLKAVDGHLIHIMQIATYKIHDSYKTTKGFRDQNVSPCAATLINPYADRETNFIHHYYDPEEAADFLAFMRRRWKQGKSTAA